MTGGRRRWARWVTAVTVIGAVHALVVAVRYHVGSFDDDASYVLAARALASGAGLTATLTAGYPLVGAYPPGYAVVLTPLALLWPHGVLALRAVSLVGFVAIFPLTWRYLGRRDIGPPVRLAVLVLLALSPVLATYATMVMPEAVFVVVVLVLLLMVDRWQQQASSLTWAGAGTLACAAGLLWLKEAGIGLVIGVAGWLILRRLWRRALLVAVIPAALFVPVLMVRSAAGGALIGSRYSGDLAGAYHGDLLGRLGHAVPHAVWAYVADALPRSIAPTGVSPLPLDGPFSGVLAILQWTAAPLVIVGLVTCWRRHRDAACVAVPVYLIGTLIYPFTNERRVVLVLPVIVAWYAVGALCVTGALKSRARPAAVLPVVAGTLALVALVAQFPRDYLYSVGQDSPAPDGSAYMAFLRGVGNRRDVVETGYLWTTAVFSGHRTANGAYLAPCERAALARAIHDDHAGYLLTAALSRPGLVDSPCVLTFGGARPEAIRLYRTGRDLASVFELVGPGTAHPDLRDLTAGAAVSASAPVTKRAEPPQTDGDPAGLFPTLPATGGTAVLTWSWAQPRPVTQVSLGAAGAGSATTSVAVALQAPDGAWHTVASAPGPVGDRATTRFLLAAPGQPPLATALRVTVAGAGTVGVHDVHAVGPDA